MRARKAVGQGLRHTSVLKQSSSHGGDIKSPPAHAELRAEKGRGARAAALLVLRGALPGSMLTGFMGRVGNGILRG